MNTEYDIRLWKASEMVKELGEPEYIVDGLLLEGSQALMYAPTGHGKSFAAVDLAAHIATGTPFHGQEVRMGSVVYVAAEAPLEIDRRVVAWERYHDKKTHNLRLIKEPIHLHNSQHMEALIQQAIKEVDASLVIFDTAERVTVGTDENKPTEVNERVNYPIQDMLSRTGVTSLLVHHAGVDGKRPRGCTAWETPNDTILRVKAKFTQVGRRQSPETITIEVQKQRGDDPISMTLKTQRIPFKSGRSTLVLTDLVNHASGNESVKESAIDKAVTKRDQVIGLLSEGGQTIQVIADAIYESNVPSAKVQLSKLKKAGLASTNGEGTWSLAG